MSLSSTSSSTDCGHLFVVMSSFSWDLCLCNFITYWCDTHSFTISSLMLQSVVWNSCTDVHVCSSIKNDEDHLVILRLGLVSVGMKMAGQANWCPEGSLAVWTGNGNGGWCWGSVCAVFSRLSVLFSCCYPVDFAGFCALLWTDACQLPSISVQSAPKCKCWCWRPSMRLLVCVCSTFSGLLGSASLVAVCHRTCLLGNRWSSLRTTCPAQQSCGCIRMV